MPNTTMMDVAKEAGVSVATVSRVLNGSDKVNEETCQKVIQACRELKYILHPVAQRLRLGRTNTISVVLPYLTLPSIVERLRGVQQALAASKFDLVLFSVGTPEARDSTVAGLSHKSRTDGLLVISMPLTDRQAISLIENEMPVVLIDADHARLNRVNVDDVEGGRLATEHLIQLGHRKIAFISSYLENPLQFSSTINRYKGYCQALEAAGIEVDPKFQREGKHGRQESEEMALDLLRQSDPPTAIFASSDTKAIGVLDAAKALRIRVPDELSIIGYDNIRDAEYLDLTTIQQPLYRSGLVGGNRLLQLIDQGPCDLEEVVLPVELVVRKTTGPAILK
jgi:DNA-binding LacI/PurR family transcriptional regulator